MEAWIQNPYFNLAAMRRADMFFGRTSLFRQYYSALLNRQSVSLIGPRHIGKSSFLLCSCLPEIQQQFPFNLRSHIFVPLDLREYLYKTSEDFFHNISKELLFQCERSHGLVLQAEGKGEEAFNSILDTIEDHSFYPVLLLDGFDNITLNKQFGPEFLSFLRAQATMGKVSYVTASIAPLYEVCHHGIAGSPFFNIFYTYRLDPLAPEEARDLVRIPAERVGIPFTSEERSWVLKMAGHHPFFIQRVCYALLEEKIQHGTGEIDLKHVSNSAYQDLLPHFQDTWQHISKEQRSILQDEAQQGEKSPRELPELSESSFFRKFVRNTCQYELFTMSPDELERALDKINNLEMLGETNLRLMKSVAQYMKKETPPTRIERGMAIREILYQAFERLHGSGIRTDEAADWRLYNILYYRYFKVHLKNEQIAFRLFFTSIRQFYRERSKAVQALLDALFEIEKGTDNHADDDVPYLLK